MRALRFGLSTCPNDTFAFHGLLEGLVGTHGLRLEFQLADIAELNEELARGELDVSKASFAAALRLADRFGVLSVGSALGTGVGPVLLGREPMARPPMSVLCPGESTTATALLRCLHPEVTDIRHLRFDAIMPALGRGEAEAGVCIHEGRFTYHEHGLVLLEDLGASWERRTGCPVPLGGVLARLDLGEPVHRALRAAVSESLALARRDPRATLPTMRRYAQELDEAVLWKHVELYVNDYTVDLGPTGRHCLEELARQAGAPSAPVILPAI